MTAAGEGWLDVSLWPHIGMSHRPGDPLFLSEPAPSMKFGDITDVSTFFTGSRTGTCVYVRSLADFEAWLAPSRVAFVYIPEERGHRRAARR